MTPTMKNSSQWENEIAIFSFLILSIGSIIIVVVGYIDLHSPH